MIIKLHNDIYKLYFIMSNVTIIFCFYLLLLSDSMFNIKIGIVGLYFFNLMYLMQNEKRNKVK